MNLSDFIPVRSNSDTGLVNASWWNVLRSAILSIAGAGAIEETQFTIADNQSSYQDVTGLLLDKDVTQSVRIDYTFYRTNGSTVERRESGYLICLYKPVAAAWTYERYSWGDDALNMADGLYLTSAGQVQYKSDSVGATYVGTMRYKIALSFNKEA